MPLWLSVVCAVAFVVAGTGLVVYLVNKLNHA